MERERPQNGGKMARVVQPASSSPEPGQCLFKAWAFNCFDVGSHLVLCTLKP